MQNVLFSRDGQSLISSSNGDSLIRIWDVKNGNEIRKLSGHTGAVSCIALTKNGDKLASGGLDYTLKIWDMNGDKILHDISDLKSTLYSMDFNPEGNKLVSCKKDNSIVVWDVESGNEISSFGNHVARVNSVCFSPDGSIIASGSDDKTIKLWDANTFVNLNTFTGHTGPVNSIVFNPQGNNLASCSDDGKIIIWDISTAKSARTFTGHLGNVNAIIFNNDGNKLVSAGMDATIGIWSISDLFENNLQEDESDSVWSIVSPKISAKDIDMGKLLVNDLKDSLVSGFIKNEGTWKTVIDTIFISGADSNAFTVVSGYGNYAVEPGKTADAVFRFVPTEERYYEADIIIITQSDSLRQKIRAEGVEPVIELTSKIINFGKVYLNYYKDTLVTAVIENISQNPLLINKIENTGPDKTQFSVIKGDEPFTLNPGETHEMELRFTSQELGRTSGNLAFHHSNVASPANVQLFAESYKITPSITSNSPICVGHDLCFYTDSIPNVEYHWTGPNGFISNEQNIIIKNAGKEHSGIYRLFVSTKDFNIKPSHDIYSDTSFIVVEIHNDNVRPGDNSLIFVGNAERIENYLKLTDSKPWDAGAIWLKNRFSILQDFTTTFTFNIKYGDNRQTAESSIPGADGFAFVLQNHAYPVVGKKGEAMGYEGISNSLAIEFDLFRNIYDPNGNHIAVQSLGKLPNTPDHRIFNSVLGMNTNIPIIFMDVLYHVKIEYNHPLEELRIYLDSNNVFNEPVLTITELDLSKLLNLDNDEYVYIGFTAATGQACQEQRIYNWVVPCDNQFVSVEDDKQHRAVGIKETVLNIYPNPTEDLLNVEFAIANTENVRIEVFDKLGNKIKSIECGLLVNGYYFKQVQFDNLPIGMYYLALRINEKTILDKFSVVK